MTELTWVLLLAVLGPAMGAALGVLLPQHKKLLPHLLAFAAGSMLALCFTHLIAESLHSASPLLCAAGLIFGALLMGLLHRLLPCGHCDHHGERTAMMMLAAVMLHNFPLGLAMAAGGEDHTVLLLAVAIATHNIPEGICTAAPYYHATGKRLQAFLLSVSSCIPTLLGFAAGRLVWMQIPDSVMAFVNAAVAGLMITICCKELIPGEAGSRERSVALPALIAGVLMILLLHESGHIH